MADYLLATHGAAQTWLDCFVASKNWELQYNDVTQCISDAEESNTQMCM